MSTQPNILAIETSGRIGSVALGTGAGLQRCAYFQANHNHAVELLPTIERLCRELGRTPSWLDQVVISIGPGSFTGLRIAVTVARTLAQSLDVRLVAVPTMPVIAHNALRAEPPPQHVAVILDAKRAEVYSAAFELQAQCYVQATAACVADPLDFLARLPQPVVLLGEGIPYHQQALDQVEHRQLPEALWQPRVEMLYRLGWEMSRREQFADPAHLTPLYLRRPEAEENWLREHGQPP